MNLPSERVPYKPEKLWWKRVKLLARSQLARFPLIETPSITIWRTGRYLFLKCRWKLAGIRTLIGTHGGTGFDVAQACWVSPQSIVHSTLREFQLQDFKGRVMGGDWDRLEKKFEDLDVYVAFKQVCVEGKDWTETVFYQRILGAINRGRLPWGCKDQSDLDQRCEVLESLFHKIEHEGYRSQHEILLSQESHNTLNGEDEVIVNIGRRGDLLFSDGAHRLAIAKLLGIQRIPVRIAVRHLQWIRFRQELLQYAKEQRGAIYQPLLHPDLHDIPAHHDDCKDRFTVIKQNMSVRRGRLLDIGANVGYYCHRFEDEGFDCYAVEDQLTHLHFLRKLKRAENKEFKIIAESVFEWSGIGYVHFDVTLALNVLHHFLKTKDSYDKLIDLLKNLQTRELFFEPHLFDEPQMHGAYRNLSPDEFVEFLAHNSGLENAEFIGTMKDGSPLYRLYC